jgi:hypothetical protein
MSQISINLRAAEARELLDAGRVEVVRVMRPQPDLVYPAMPILGLQAVDDHDILWPFPECCFDSFPSGPVFKSPLPAPGAVVACREPFKVDDGTDEDGAYGCTYLSTGTRWQMDYSEVDMGRMKPGATYRSPSCPTWAIRLHARVESRGAEVRDGKWCWVAVVVKTEKGGE